MAIKITMTCDQCKKNLNDSVMRFGAMAPFEVTEWGLPVLSKDGKTFVPGKSHMPGSGIKAQLCSMECLKSFVKSIPK